MITGWRLALSLGTMSLLALFYQGLWGTPSYIPPVVIGTQAPEIVGPELVSGATLSSQHFSGKVVLLNWWASWCEECKQMHPNLLAIQQRFGHDQNFLMLGINYQDRESDAKAYLEAYGNAYPHIRDLDGVISIDYGVYGVPETFVIDQEGIIRYKYIGPLVGSAYVRLTDNVLEPLLRGESPQGL